MGRLLTENDIGKLGILPQKSDGKRISAEKPGVVNLCPVPQPIDRLGGPVHGKRGLGTMQGLSHMPKMTRGYGLNSNREKSLKINVE